MGSKKESRLRRLNVLMPVDTLAQAEQLLPLATVLLGGAAGSRVTLIGITPVALDTSLSEGGLWAQRLRNELERLAEENPVIERLAGSFVSHHPWEDVEAVVDDRRQDNDLLLLPWQSDLNYLQTSMTRMLSDPHCDLAMVQPSVHPRDIRRILLPVRGGPFANLSLHLAVRMARAANAEITLLRVVSSDDDPMSQILREKFTGLSDSYPEITAELQVVGDAGAAILQKLKEHQAVILGASASADGSPVGLVARLILQRNDITTLIVKTKEPFRLPPSEERRSLLPLLVRVEKWFAENTFHSREFSDIGRLIDMKRKQGLRISLALNTLNDEAHIRNLITPLKGALMEDAPLLDEIVLIDGNSTDLTRRIAAELGVPPYIHQEILPGLGSHRGKGEAMWKSLYLCKGDIILWMDGYIVDPHPRLVYGAIGPLLLDSRIQYVKGFYSQPVEAGGDLQRSESDWLTEILARPIINLFFAELSGLVQPLSSIHGGRRAALEQVPFYSGYGAEMGLLLGLLERFGLKAIAQVDLETVELATTEARPLSKKAFAVLQVLVQHLKQKGIIDPQATVERTMKALRVEERIYLEEVDIRERQRPPMTEVKEYRGRHSPRRM